MASKAKTKGANYEKPIVASPIRQLAGLSAKAGVKNEKALSPQYGSFYERTNCLHIVGTIEQDTYKRNKSQSCD